MGVPLTSNEGKETRLDGPGGRRGRGWGAESEGGRPREGGGIRGTVLRAWAVGILGETAVSRERGIPRKERELNTGVLRLPFKGRPLCWGAEVLMHVPFWLPECLKVMELSAIKRTSGSSARRSHSPGYLHTQEGH